MNQPLNQTINQLMKSWTDGSLQDIDSIFAMVERVVRGNKGLRFGRNE